MVRFPSCNDRELAQALGARPSTVTAVRARLLGRGLCRRAYVPSLGALGAGVLSISHGDVPSDSRLGLKRALGRGLFPAEECDSFFALAGPSGWLEMGAFPSYSEAQRRGEGLPRLLGGLPGAAAGGPTARSCFPVELVRFGNFFDFAPLLGRLFRLQDARTRLRHVPAAPARRLSPVEKLALYGLVKRPGASDGEIAVGLGVSRQAVARARRLLVGEGRLLPAVIPDLGKLGFGLLAMFRFRLAARRSPEGQDDAVEKLLDGIPHIFALLAGAECLVLGAYRDLPGFEHETAAMGRTEGASGLLDSAPEVQTFLLGDTALVRDQDYVPFVKAALGLDIVD